MWSPACGHHHDLITIEALSIPFYRCIITFIKATKIYHSIYISLSEKSPLFLIATIWIFVNFETGFFFTATWFFTKFLFHFTFWHSKKLGQILNTKKFQPFVVITEKIFEKEEIIFQLHDQKHFGLKDKRPSVI